MPRVKNWKDPNYLKSNIICYAVMNEMELPEVAKRAKISESTLYRYLRKPADMRLGVLQNLAKLFNCKIEDLIYPKLNT